jgi:hypothetical protein
VWGPQFPFPNQQPLLLLALLCQAGPASSLPSQIRTAPDSMCRRDAVRPNPNRSAAVLHPPLCPCPVVHRRAHLYSTAPRAPRFFPAHRAQPPLHRSSCRPAPGSPSPAAPASLPRAHPVSCAAVPSLHSHSRASLLRPLVRLAVSCPRRGPPPSGSYPSSSLSFSSIHATSCLPPSRLMLFPACPWLAGASPRVRTYLCP